MALSPSPGLCDCSGAWLTANALFSAKAIYNQPRAVAGYSYKLTHFPLFPIYQRPKAVATYRLHSPNPRTSSPGAGLLSDTYQFTVSYCSGSPWVPWECLKFDRPKYFHNKEGECVSNIGFCCSCNEYMDGSSDFQQRKRRGCQAVCEVSYCLLFNRICRSQGVLGSQKHSGC